MTTRRLMPSNSDLTAAFGPGILLPVPTDDTFSGATNHHTKISIIGTGNVGMAIAHTILSQDLADEIALFDANPNKLLGEKLDLQHASAFLPRIRILAESNYNVTKDSDLIIIAAGARRKPDEPMEVLLHRNVETLKGMVPELAALSPEAVLVVVSNPVDVLAYVAWKLSGFPANRVIGSGTNLDSSRFRFLVADYLQVNAQDIQAYVVGEHGGNSVSLWSGVSIGGIPILSYLDQQSEEFEQGVLEKIHRAVVESAHEVMGLKGYTSWAIGYSVANLARSILRNQMRLHPVSLLAKGSYGIPDDEEVYLSLPAQLGRGGVQNIINVHLTEAEEKKLKASADALWEVQQKLAL